MKLCPLVEQNGLVLPKLSCPNKHLKKNIKTRKMVEKIEDLNLPMAVVSRIMKDALPENASCSKESRNALTRAASVFILYERKKILSN